MDAQIKELMRENEWLRLALKAIRVYSIQRRHQMKMPVTQIEEIERIAATGLDEPDYSFVEAGFIERLYDMAESKNIIDDD